MKKHKIEDIFSSMEDFSTVPPPELWGQIEEKLDKPKKKKRVVLWWSAAACLLLGLLLPTILHFTASPENINLNNGGLENSTNSVVLDKKTNDDANNKNLDQNRNSSKTADSLNENSAIKNQFNTGSGIQVEETSVAHSNSTNKNNKKDSKYSAPSTANVPNESIAFQNSVSSEEKASVKSSKKSVLENSAKSSNRSSYKGVSEERVAFGKTNQFNSKTEKQLSNSIFEEKLNTKNNLNVAFNTSASDVNANISKQNTAKAKAVYENTSAELAFKGDSKDNLKNNLKNNLNDGFKDNSKFNSNALTKVDSAQLAELQNLEKGISTPEVEKDKKEKKDKKIDPKERWNLAVFAGVASSENTNNEKTLGNVNDSKQSSTYGVKTKYNINKKWAVSSGLKFNELGQSVANVSYVNAKNNALFVPGASSMVSDAAPVGNSSEYLFVSNSTKEALKSDNVQSGNLDQSLRYIEMPLEVSYAVFNKNRASINLNTGGFVGKLISNNVALDGHSIGQNIDANDYVYGSTLSSTVQYRVYKKTNVFVEPAVNYYINPLNSQSFNQFQWGLNFGLNFNF
ncbi:hypothetical protein ACWA1F_22965 [Flavobacterium sp. 3-218]